VTTRGDKKHIKSLASPDPRTAWTPSLRLTLLWFALICLVLAVGLPVSGFAREAFKRHITVYGSSTLLDQYPRNIADNYDLVITEWWKNRSSVANIKKMNPDIKIIFYRDLNGLYTSYDDWTEASQHPTWFVRDTVTNKPLVRKTFGWYLMDLTNVQYRQHLKQYLLRKLDTYPVFDGVFLDDVEANINPANFVVEGTTIPGTMGADYVQRYRDGIFVFLQELKAALAAKLVVINSDDRTLYIQYVDGIMLEGLFHGSWQPVNYHEDNVSWLADMQSLANLLTLNKMVLVQSGSQGSGTALQNQFLFCFASFLMLCNQNTYFFFDTSTSGTQLLPFPQYTQGLGPALASLPASSFATTVIQRPMSSSMTGWAAGGGSPSVVQVNGRPALQFVSNGANGAYVSRCIDLSGSTTGALNISCSAKGSNVSAGSISWMRFALLGKFYDVNNNLLLAGADLPFDLGTYNWKAYSASYPLPPATRYYCVSALGFYPSSLGTGWVQNLQINSVVSANQWFKRVFQQATVFVDPSNTVASTGFAKQPSLQPDTGYIVSN
jgi:hypothetical protein